MKFVTCFLFLTLLLIPLGCETAEKVTTEGGQVIGKTSNVVGGVTKGGAEAIKGETAEENPYGR